MITQIYYILGTIAFGIAFTCWNERGNLNRILRSCMFIMTVYSAILTAIAFHLQDYFH